MPTNALTAQPPGSQLISLLFVLAIAVPILILRNAKPRALKIEQLWVRPIIFIALMCVTLAAAAPPLTPVSIGLLLAALAVGCGFGWWRGRLMRIDVHPETHDITARASPIAMVFILGLLMLRYGLRGALTEEAPLLHIPIMAAADALVLMAVGMMVTQGIEMWLRARRLLAEAQAANGPPAPNIIS